MISLSIAFGFAVVFGFLVCLLAWVATVSFTAGVSLVLIQFLVDLAFGTVLGINLGVTIYPADFVYGLLGLAGMLRLLRMPKLQVEQKLWLAFGAVLFASFALGTLYFRTAAGVEFRVFYYFWAGAFYFMTFTPSATDVARLINLFMLAATVNVGIVCYRWVAIALGLPGVAEWNEGGTSLRVVTAQQTFLLAQALILALYLASRGGKVSRWVAMIPAFLICVVVLQHRTTWAVTLAGVACMVLLSKGRRARALGPFVVALATVAALSVPLLSSGLADRVTRALGQSVVEVGSERSTLAWRVSSWKTLTTDWVRSGPRAWAIGKPFGAGFQRIIEAYGGNFSTTANPHNFFVYTLIRTGVLGVILLLATYMALFVQLQRSSSGLAGIDGPVLQVLLITQLVYFIGYPAPSIGALTLGLAFAFLNRVREPGRSSPLQAHAYSHGAAHVP